ncbi:MAG: hypothetical protein LW706_02800 [Chitinophagaceae bacterium]|nr:hypothetical protein [Chitinophagaceae bacterium]
MSEVSAIAERFMRYVKVDTQSDPASHSYPSTEKQKDLSRLLVEELKGMGWNDVTMDQWGYVIGSIPSNSIRKVPVVCFCSHVDTAPDCSGMKRWAEVLNILILKSLEQMLHIPSMAENWDL